MTPLTLPHRTLFTLPLALALIACPCTKTDTKTCTTPPGKENRTLAKALAQVAPDYRVKAPAGSEKHLGHRLVGQQPETNACFKGKLADAPTGGWSRIEMEYETSVGGGLNIDFSSIVQVPLNVGTNVEGKKTIGLTLETLREHTLENVFFVADGTCADDFETVETMSYDVITRAIKAEAIEITGANELIAGTKVEVAKIGGVELETTNKNKRRWEGASLFFADYPECIDVRVQKKRCENLAIGPGNVCDLGTCSVQVEAKDGNAWKGNLSCQGGNKVPLEDTIGNYSKTEEVADGVSYNARVVNGSGVGSVTIELRRWSVKTGEGCGG